MPRVGSKQSIVRTPPATQRAIVTFCWLPPDRRRTSRAARVSIWSVSIAPSTPCRSRPRSIGPQRRCASRTGARCSRAPSAASAAPRRGRRRRRRGRHGWRRPGGGTTPACRRPAARRRSGGPSPPGCRTARPGPGPRAPRRRAPRPGTGRTRRPCSFVPAVRSRATSRGVGARCGSGRGARSAAGISSTISPSISSTIRSSEPGVTSTTPTVSPSRRTVARSHTAAISIIRCEMKITRAVAAALAADDLEDPLGEVGGQRGGHLVEHQHVRLDRQRAREVDDPQRGERHLARQVDRSRSLEAELVQPVAERLDRRLGEPQVGPDVEVGDERRLLVDRDDAAAPGLGRRVGRRAACRGR